MKNADWCRALKASMAASPESVPLDEIPDEQIQKANDDYQASREAYRDEERRRRAEKAGPSSTTLSNPSLPTPPLSATPSEPPRPADSATAPASPSLPLFQNREFVDRLKLSDRAQLEKERLARQAAKAAQSGAVNGGSGSSLANGGPSAGPSRLPDHPLQSAGPYLWDLAGEYYPEGEMRHSALSIGDATNEKTFSASDMIGRASSPFITVC